MIVISVAESSKLSRYAGVVGEESGWLENGPELTANPPDPASHAELTHVGLDSLHVFMHEKSLNHIKGPARGKPRMPVEKETSMFPLVLVHLRAESDVSLFDFSIPSWNFSIQASSLRHMYLFRS